MSDDEFKYHTHEDMIDYVEMLRIENERLREALKPFTNATVIDLTHNGENFVKAIVVSEDEILCARAALEGATEKSGAGNE